MKYFKITGKKSKKTLLKKVSEKKFHPMQGDVLDLKINEDVMLQDGIMFPDRTGFQVDIIIKRIS